MNNIKSFLHHFFLSPKQYSLTNFFILLILILFIQASVLSLHTVVSESMEDTLLVGDTILVLKTWYGFRLPFSNRHLTPGFSIKHNEIIICAYPGDPKQEYVKRCAATGEDIVAINRKILYVNGNLVPLPEHGKNDDPEILHKDNARRDFYPLTIVPEDSLFVLGDNRDFSFDSRSWGCLPKRNLRGRVTRILWSIDPEVPWTDLRHKIRLDRFFKRVK